MKAEERKRQRLAQKERDRLALIHDAKIQKRLDVIGMSLEEFRSKGMLGKDRVWDMVETAESKI